MLREGMGHAGDKAKRGGSGINHICLLFLQGPCAERTSGAVGHGTASLSAPSPQGGTHRSGAGNPSPPPRQRTHPQLLPRQHHCGSAGTRGASQTLGDNDNAGHAGCCPRAPRQARSSSSSASSQPSPWCGTVGPHCHILGSKGPKFWQKGRQRPHLPAGLVCLGVLAALGSLSAPAQGGKNSKMERRCTPGCPIGPPCTPGTGQEGRVSHSTSSRHSP